MKRSIQVRISLLLISMLLFAAGQTVFMSQINNHDQAGIYAASNHNIDSVLDNDLDNVLDNVMATKHMNDHCSESAHCNTSMGSSHGLCGGCDTCSHCVSCISSFSIAINNFVTFPDFIFIPAFNNTDLPVKDRPPRNA